MKQIRASVAHFAFVSPTTPKKDCQTLGISRKIWTHADTVDMELRFGVELFHARGAMEWLGQRKQPT